MARRGPREWRWEEHHENLKGNEVRHDDTLKAPGMVKNYQDSSPKSLSPKTPPSLQAKKDTQLLLQTVNILMMPAQFDLLNAGPQASQCRLFLRELHAVHVARHGIVSAIWLVFDIHISVSTCFIRDKMFFY